MKRIEESLKGFSERPVKGFGCTISTVERKGSVDYKAIPVLEHVDLNQYRKPSTEYKKITHEKEES